MPISNVYNEDCMIYMRTIPDKHFELAIVDPPYGLGAIISKWGSNSLSKFNDEKEKVETWDNNAPDISYFNELFRVSKNQIIWGGNYYSLPACRGFVVWDKMVYIPSMSQIEYAWTSFDRLPKLIKINNTDPNRIHLTQKPVKLYRWLLQNYAKQGDKIFDSHLGSGSSRIAAYELGFDFWATELDADYFKAQNERFANHLITRPALFDKPAQPKQLSIV